MNSDWIFHSIDTILPFEVCLYHQVVPLSMEGSRIYLGMVNPDDIAALEYLRQLLGYLNCSLVSQTIAPQEHQALLTAYLNHSNQLSSRSPSPEVQKDDPVPSIPPNLPSLNLTPRHLTCSVSDLALLSPPQMIQELLARVLIGGIGRLHFARESDAGNILWSQDGVPKSVLKALPLSTFQAVINELKRLMGLPLLPVRQQKEVELERLYHDTPVLLRLRVMRGDDGEEATLQVLRGAALKFYQQQKLIDLSQEVLITAQNLQKKLVEIQETYQRHPSLSQKHLEVIPALIQVLEQVDAHVKILESAN
ncbi:hypothetical protein NEA10_04325 [Phormidium yuhuli AB48]|uniref:Type II secretion system protein GspE N-terminal domain-containing protein n=1 Tax=Phormidium yuhuli AB48 TaxID=2940671 RepID=A0ABY5AT11_9CYAN|nr:hypothetical protein [Phormidium yuhuli]USR91957.1 hypothetical protein NEA10_04325 [Phormidium yuhuli AB48]